MTFDLSEKLQTIADKKQKLLEEETRLIQKRKQDIGALAEKIGLLAAPDALLAGLLLEGKKIMEDGGKRQEDLAANGHKFLYRRKNTQTANQAASQT